MGVIEREAGYFIVQTGRAKAEMKRGTLIIKL